LAYKAISSPVVGNTSLRQHQSQGSLKCS